jgi:hypothetical protein
MTRVISYEETSELDQDYLSNMNSDRHWYYFAGGERGLRISVMPSMLIMIGSRDDQYGFGIKAKF